VIARSNLVIGLGVLAALVTSTVAPALAETRAVYFGSSTTQGVGSNPYYRRWTTQVSRYLGWEEVNAGLPNSALTAPPQTSWLPRVPSAVERWRGAIVPYRPDRVLFMYGANDMAIRAPIEPFRANMRALVGAIAAEIGPDRLVVLTPQPNRAGLANRAAYDQAIRDAAQAAGAHFIDAGKAFPASFLPDYSQDQLHMNNWGHSIFASYVTRALAELGLAPPAAAAWGGSRLNRPTSALKGGYLRIDEAAPLSTGEITQIEVVAAGSGEAAIGVMRPNDRNGFDAVYKTDVLNLVPGILRVTVPHWRVMGGDRLAVWTSGDVLAGYEPLRPQAWHLAVETDRANPIHDVASFRWRSEPQVLALRTEAFVEAAP
jgi:lysophospholipase L1-like esterase